MALPNDKRALQDRLSRVATRMAQKFGNGVFTGVTAGATGSPGIPVSVLVNRIAGKKIALDSLGNENASALSFTVLDTANGATATQDNIVASTYIPSQLPTGFYGSATALVMLAKLKAGTDSVDIHVVADSNSGSAATGNWGYSRGLARGLVNGCCAEMYATSLVVPGLCYQSGAGQLNGGALHYQSDAYYTHVNSGTGNTFSGGDDAPDEIRSYMNFQPTTLGYGFGNVAGGVPSRSRMLWARQTNNSSLGQTYGSSEMNLIFYYDPGVCGNSEYRNGIDTRNKLTYRLVHSLIPGHTGTTGSTLVLYFHGISNGAGYCGHAMSGHGILGSSSSLGATFYPPIGVASNLGQTYSGSSGVNGATAKTVSKLEYPADSSRCGVTLAYSWGSRGGGGWRNTYGPYAVYLESAHCNKKGWAINTATYLPGYTTGGIASELENAGLTFGAYNNNAIKTILQETRERQIDAGGSGNVIVFLNSGINDKNEIGEAPAAAVYKTEISRIVLTFKTQWESLGYPENDLAFLVTTTHPVDDNDASLDTIRDKGEEYASTQYDANRNIDPYSNVTYVNINELGATYGTLLNGNSFNGGGTYLRDSGNVHLTAGNTGGYNFISELIMKKALRYTMAV